MGNFKADLKPHNNSHKTSCFAFVNFKGFNLFGIWGYSPEPSCLLVVYMRNA